MFESRILTQSTIHRRPLPQLACADESAAETWSTSEQWQPTTGHAKLSTFDGCCIFCHEDTKARRNPFDSSCALHVFVTSWLHFGWVHFVWLSRLASS